MPTAPIQVGDRVLDIELDGLSPRAAAVACIWSANRLHSPCPIVMESTRPLGDLLTDPDEAAVWGPAALAKPHRIVIDFGRRLPGMPPGDDVPRDGSPIPESRRAELFREQLELIATRLPVGYVPVGGGADRGSVAVALDRDALAEDDLITRDQLVDLLRRLGRPVSPAVIANYKRRPPAGWPQPVKYVGRTPLWSRRAVAAYAAGQESA